MPEVDIRPYVNADEDGVLGLLAQSLGKVADEQYRSFFRWKHLENSFGRSPMWVATVGGELAGFRAFLRWRFVDGRGERVDAVRAVDTATHPRFRGQGVFQRLTLHALDELRAAGIAFVFNTPNDQSRPGYLKMGWSIVGRVPVQVRPAGPVALVRMARARTPAELWSQPSSAGVPVSEVLAGREPADSPPAHGLRTDRTADHLRWRYEGFEPVGGRAVELPGGLAVVRFRRRGTAVEATVDELLVPGTGGRVPARPLVRAARSEGADYLLAGVTPALRGFVRTGRLGPVLTWRGLAGAAEPPAFDLSLGDVELF